MGAGDEEEAYEFRAPTGTERLVLRARRAAEEVALNALASNPAVALNLCATIAGGEERLMSIVEQHSGRLIGGGGYGTTGLGSGIEVTLWIGEPDWGRGLGTEAAHALIDHAFASENFDVLWCSNRVTNARARRVIEKCGFQFRGSGMVRLPARGAFPIERFALDRRTWASLKGWGATNHRGGTGDAPRETAA